MTFEVFRPGPRAAGRRPGPPQVRVRPNGLLQFNKSARDLLGNPHRVVLLFDVVRRAMAFQADNGNSPHAYSMGKTNGQVSGVTFCRKHHIPEGRYDLTEESGLLVADVINRADLRRVS